jgi:hypothetical protein
MCSEEPCRAEEDDGKKNEKENKKIKEGIYREYAIIMSLFAGSSLCGAFSIYISYLLVALCRFLQPDG